MWGAQGSGDWHPPILRAEWKSNGRLHLQTQMSYFHTSRSQERRDSAELPYRPLPAPNPPICPPPPLALPPPPHPPSPLGRSDDTAGEQIVSSSGHVRDVYSEGSPDVLSKKRKRAPPLFCGASSTCLCLCGATKRQKLQNLLSVLRF